MDAKEIPARPNLEQYKKQAKDLTKSRKSGDAESLRRIRQNHPRLRKLTDSDFLNARFALADAQLVIAREHGFESWPKFAKHIEGVNKERSPVSQFESAADAVITGDVATLKSLLRENPQLIRERSTRVHQATLLHYVSANGVEDYRQKSPKNAVEVAKILLRAGAEVDALAETYGGGIAQTTLNLLVSSFHPAKTGVQAALVETLLDFGAAINGLGNDGSPLITALAFHYTDAADALAARGARVDNIVVAAGLGREDLISNFIDGNGSLKADVPLLDIGWIRLPKDPKANMEMALVWAAMHHRTGAVELLLKKGVDPSARDHRRWTALHWAAYYGYVDTLELLLKWSAPLEAENEFGGTVLGQVIWTTVYEGFEKHHLHVIRKLIDAGAKTSDGWLGDEFNLPLNEQIAEMLRRHRANS